MYEIFYVERSYYNRFFRKSYKDKVVKLMDVAIELKKTREKMIEEGVEEGYCYLCDIQNLNTNVYKIC